MPRDFNRKSRNAAPLFMSIAKARKDKGLTQSALARELGVPQGQVSRVESGLVDVRISSLVEQARLVDLEVVLIPRKWVPAVSKLIGQDEAKSAFLYRLSK